MEILTQSNIFKGLDKEMINILLYSADYHIKKYEKDELIFRVGDRCNQLYIVLSGSVRGEMIDANGNMVTIEDIEAPKPIAPAFIFGQQNIFPVSVSTNEDSSILVISKASLLRIFQQNTTVLQNYIDIVSNRTQFLTRKLKFLSFHSIKAKYASYLLEQAQKHGDSFEIKQSHQQLSDLFGVTRPALTRVIRGLHNEGIIEVSNKNVKVLDKAELSRMIY